MKQSNNLNVRPNLQRNFTKKLHKIIIFIYFNASKNIDRIIHYIKKKGRCELKIVAKFESPLSTI